MTFPHTFVHTAPPPADAQGPLGAAPIGLGDYVTATPEQIQRAVRRFMHPLPPRPPPTPEKPKKRSGKRRARVHRGELQARPGALRRRRRSSARRSRRRFKLPVYAAGVAHAEGPLPAEHGVAPAPRLYSIRDRGGKPPSGLPARRAGERDRGPVLRHPGHDLAQPADPRRRALDPADGRPQLSRLLRRREDPPRRLGDAARRLLGLEQPQPRRSRTAAARHRPLAHPHPRALDRRGCSPTSIEEAPHDIQDRLHRRGMDPAQARPVRGRAGDLAGRPGRPDRGRARRPRRRSIPCVPPKPVAGASSRACSRARSSRRRTHRKNPLGGFKPSKGANAGVEILEELRAVNRISPRRRHPRKPRPFVSGSSWPRRKRRSREGGRLHGLPRGPGERRRAADARQPEGGALGLTVERPEETSADRPRLPALAGAPSPRSSAWSTCWTQGR